MNSEGLRVGSGERLSRLGEGRLLVGLDKTSAKERRAHLGLSVGEWAVGLKNGSWSGAIVVPRHELLVEKGGSGAMLCVSELIWSIIVLGFGVAVLVFSVI